jgi:hypothetical protein
MPDPKTEQRKEQALRDAGKRRRDRMRRTGAKTYSELRSKDKGPKALEYRAGLDPAAFLPEHEVRWPEFRALVCRRDGLHPKGGNTKVHVQGVLTFLRANGLATATGIGDEMRIQKLPATPVRKHVPRPEFIPNNGSDDLLIRRIDTLEQRIRALELANAS